MAESDPVKSCADKLKMPQREGCEEAEDDWFYQCLTFLRDLSWVFDFQVIRFFVERTWEKIPPQWKQHLLNLKLEELNNIPFGETKDDWPESFCNFIETAMKMSISSGNDCPAPADIPCALKTGMSPKKQHEVSLMAAFLHHLLEEASVKTVVDVGAGLGYLGQVLQVQYGYTVISLECDANRTHGAQKRSEKPGEPTIDKPISVTFDLQDDPEVMGHFKDLMGRIVSQAYSASANRGVVEGKDKICMTGLHCCGDLTPAMLNYFIKLDCITLLACVSCCYHRMSSHTDEDSAKEVRSFPLSQSCRHAIRKIRLANQQWTLGTPAFRLAAQETRARWKNQTEEDHDFHQRNVAYRGLLELFCHEENLTLNKTTRKIALKKHCDTFDDYIEAVFSRVNLIAGESQNLREWRQKLKQLYIKNEEFFSYIEPLTALQVLLQPVLENLVYQDRKRFLEEQGFRSDIISLFDDSISPRNLVLLARKPGNTSSDTSVT